MRRIGYLKLAAVACIATSLLVACDRGDAPAETAATAPPPAPAETAPASDRATLGAFGIDTAGMDTSVVPGDDFYGYTNGTWDRTTEIPADRSRYGMFTLLLEKALARTRGIVEDAAKKDGATGAERQVGDFYVAYMDEAGIEAKGVEPVKPALEEIAGIADRMRLAVLLGGQLRADVDLLNATNYYTERPFGLWVAPHLEKPETQVPYLVQGGLALPDRDFYLEGGRFEEIRKQYLAYIAELLTLAGIGDADAKAQRVLDLETKIARVHATQVETNDIKRGANYWQREDFAQRAPGLDWDAYFEAAGLAKEPELVVWQPQAIAGISALVKSEPIGTWQDYLTFHVLHRAAPFLTKAFDEAQFAFNGTVLFGTPQQQDRWKRAINATNAALGEALGQLYVAKHFSPETKAKLETMVSRIVLAFDRRIEALEWMTPETKQRARKKLAGLAVGVGYPERWRDYSALEIRRDDALGNVERAQLFEYRRNLAKLGTPADRGEWFLLPQVVNALNVPLENRLIFPAAILEAPFFDPNADDAVNYGAIGGIIGHEITHSFDSSGALFDETGKLANWWAPADLARFETESQALIAQYDAYKPFEDLALNGKLTIGENIADVAGLAAAYDAYQASHEGQAPVVLGGLTPEQRFFLGWAQQYRSKYREPALRNLVITDVHAPGPWRAVTVRNLPGWYPAFDVKEGQKLYLPPEQRVVVW